MNSEMKKIMIYAHDHTGFSNLERILSISADLLDSDPDLSILLVSGSPMMQSFRIPNRLDYIKLPALKQVEKQGSYALDLSMEDADIIRFRSRLILTAAITYNPDLFLVDKTPNGIGNELVGVLNHLKIHAPEMRQVLLMGNSLDPTEVSLKTWEVIRHHQSVELFYDSILVAGSPDIIRASRGEEAPVPVGSKARSYPRIGEVEKISQLILAEVFQPQEKESAPIFSTPTFSDDVPAKSVIIQSRL